VLFEEGCVKKMNFGALRESIDAWYKEDSKRLETFEAVISGKAGFSLRTIDWFVTNYTARKPVVYQQPEIGKVVDVNCDYKDELRCFHKIAFDSFRRKGLAKTPEEAELRQKNFFKWAITNGIVDYVAKNATEIERDMVTMRKRCRECIEDELSRRPRKKSRAKPVATPPHTLIKEEPILS